MSLIAIERKIAALETQMRLTAEGWDFERASRLRDEIAELRGQASPNVDAPLVRQPPPGQMGLGTHIPVALPPKDWRKPRKPDPMTRFSTRGRSPSKR